MNPKLIPSEMFYVCTFLRDKVQNQMGAELRVVGVFVVDLRMPELVQLVKQQPTPLCVAHVTRPKACHILFLATFVRGWHGATFFPLCVMRTNCYPKDGVGSGLEGKSQEN